ncbi:DEKNAAC105641 [Brettanomyces naardenensis]|uniref:DEKNAAC105641 n=1 Tax=Brettanomyces naardenensis TaxID=13370 RepID=A0A448YTZ2_BRENA|nr:DEKNAAC105641 [Brettanomyces naardenensis]
MSSGAIDHLALSESLGYHIFRKKKRRSWSPDEDKQLKESVFEYFMEKHHLDKYTDEDIQVDEIDWMFISSKLPSRKSKECRKRWTSSLNPCLRKGKWTSEEDALLIKAYKKYGSSWQKVSAEIKGRNEDQCSKRYTEVLNTNTNDRLKPWTMEEDLLLINGVKKFGTKWRTISKTIPGRPSLTCRNRWRRIMTDVAKNCASDQIMKAVGVLDRNGNALYTFDENSKADRTKPKQNEGTEERPQDASSMPSIATVHPTPTAIRPRVAASPSVSPSYLSANSPAGSSISSGSGSVSVTTPTMNILGHKITAPTRSYTEWRFALLDPHTNEEIPQFAGPVATPELAHQLIELAKYNGVSLTIHQHIHHHYSPSSPVLDPQASVSRFSHFNYLPPLTEVPKLTSSSPDNAANSSGNSPHSHRATPSATPGESSLIRLLNTESKPPNEGQVSGNSPSSRLAPQRQQLTDPMHGSKLSNEDVEGKMANRANVRSNRAEFGEGADGEDMEEEVDFWETLRSITQPKTGRPVSQHHPLHYFEASEDGSYAPNENANANVNTNAVNSQTSSNSSTARNRGRGNAVAGVGGKFSEVYGNEPEEEEMENDANQYGMYYNVFANKGGVGPSKTNESGNLGYLMPFNPS